MPTPLYVGVDAGGTSTAALARVGTETRRLYGPGAQAFRDGPAAAAATIAALVGEARTAFEEAPLAGLAVGIAGGGRAEERDAVQVALRDSLGTDAVSVTDDAVIALEAAYGEESGTILVVGTGSIGYARTLDGDILRVGGWGAALVDDGSGASLGRAALRAVLADYDGGPPTSLGALAATLFGLQTADAVRAEAAGGRLARFAPLLLAGATEEDWVATSTLARETNALAQQLGWLATRVGDSVTPRLTLAGGLSGEPVYTASLLAALDRHLPGWSLASTPADPAEGALAMALRMA